MQKIVSITCSVNAYLSDPEAALGTFERTCPFCAGNAHLRRHGWYHRGALFDDQDQMPRIPVLRLLCPRTGKTVSLLPDFCLPRRQTGPAILAVFLYALVFKGLSLCASLLEARRDLTSETTHHAQAQVMRDRFIKRLPKLRAYLARIHDRITEAPREIPKKHRGMATVILWMQQVQPDPRKAFIHHGRLFHKHCQEGLL